MEVDIIRCYMSAIDMIGYIKKYGVEIILILAYIGIMSLVAQIMYTPYNPPTLNIKKNMITGKYVAVMESGEYSRVIEPYVKAQYFTRSFQYTYGSIGFISQFVFNGDTTVVLNKNMTDEEKEKLIQCLNDISMDKRLSYIHKDKEVGHPRISIIEEKDLDERKYEIMKKLEIQAREKSLEDRSERYNSLL